jgi:addiction module HigA family antidote
MSGWFFDSMAKMLSMSTIWIIIKRGGRKNMSRMFNPAHPGEILREFLPEGMTVTECAGRLGITRVALSRILNGRSGVSAEMAIRIGILTGTSPESWLDNQMKWDLKQAEQRPRPKIAPLTRVS